MSGIKIRKTSLDNLDLVDPDLFVSPLKQNLFCKFLVNCIAKFTLKRNGFIFDEENSDMDFSKKPCLILMNHIFELDFLIAFYILRKVNFNISTCEEAFIGRRGLLKRLGCISTLRFNNDIFFAKSAYEAIHKLNNSLLIYPESEYTPDGLGQCVAPQFGSFVKYLGVPVYLIRTYGNFNFRPAFTDKINKSKLSATIKCVLSEEDIKNKDQNEIKSIINNIFMSNNYYKERKDLDLKLTNKDRANDYHRLFFKCPHCLKEGEIKGGGNIITCNCCGNKYILNEDHSLKNLNGETKFDHVENWIRWQKSEVINELVNNTLNINMKCKMYVFKNSKALYDVNKIVDVTYKNDKLYIKYDDVILEKDLTKQWGICAMPRCVKVGATIVTEVGENNYFLCPVIDNGLVYKLRVAVAESYKLKSN